MRAFSLSAQSPNYKAVRQLRLPQNDECGATLSGWDSGNKLEAEAMAAWHRFFPVPVEALRVGGIEFSRLLTLTINWLLQ
jgi:hypothetical protein